jgi:hypothetical protein
MAQSSCDGLIPYKRNPTACPNVRSLKLILNANTSNCKPFYAEKKNYEDNGFNYINYLLMLSAFKDAASTAADT